MTKASDFMICGVCGKYYSRRIVLKNNQRMVKRQLCCGFEIGATRASQFTPQDVKIEELDKIQEESDKTLGKVKPDMISKEEISKEYGRGKFVPPDKKEEEELATEEQKEEMKKLCAEDDKAYDDEFYLKLTESKAREIIKRLQEKPKDDQPEPAKQ